MAKHFLSGGLNFDHLGCFRQQNEIFIYSMTSIVVINVVASHVCPFASDFCPFAKKKKKKKIIFFSGGRQGGFQGLSGGRQGRVVVAADHCRPP